RELGRHRGLIHYTVGQRRGLELGGLTEPLYVIRLEPEEQRVVVGPKRALAVSAARLIEPNWLTKVEGRQVWAKVRSLAKPVPGRLEGDWLRFDSDEYGVAPGQAAVLYDGDRVLGGAWIDETVGVHHARAA
ncbi:MAG: tRNA methyl transferase PRC-barrel domain-containing protein, partial [Casimicrobium sp.]